MRRHLGTTRAELRSKPWWEHDLVVEGVLEEFTERDESDPTRIDEDEDELLEEELEGGEQASLSDLEASGVTVRRVG